MSDGFFDAIKKYRAGRIKSLIQNGMSLKVSSHNGESPLMAALHIEDGDRRQRMFRYLARHGADLGALDQTTSRDVLAWSCFLDRTSEALTTIADQSGNIDFQRKDCNGKTPLHYAAVNGNIRLIKTIVDYMSKYSIPVDIRDNDGFTPYILARRMGNTEAAEILASGGASKQQMDSKNHRSVREWSWIREREKSFAVHKLENQRLGTYKVLGRLPAIKAAGFKPDKVKIVESKFDKHFLHQDSTGSMKPKTHNLYTQKTWLDFNRLKAKHNTRSMPELMDLNKQKTNLLMPNPGKKLPAPAKKAVYPTSQQKFVFETPMNWGKSSNENIHIMLGLLESQCTHSYRPRAIERQPAPPRPLPGLHRMKQSREKKRKKTDRRHSRRFSSRRESNVTVSSITSSVAPVIAEE